MITKEDRAKAVKDYGRKAKDTGSPEVQVALLTQRIQMLTGHLQRHVKDHHSRRGLMLMVGKRNNLLRFLAKEDETRYLDLIKRLGLRK